MANIDRVKLPDNSEYNLQARVIGAVNGNVAVMDGNGNVADSGTKLSDIEKRMNISGAKNWLHFPYADGWSKTVGNATFTVYSDGRIKVTASGTINQYTSFVLSHVNDIDFESELSDYELIGCPDTTGMQYLRLAYYDGVSDIFADTGSGVTIPQNGKFDPVTYPGQAIFISFDNGSVLPPEGLMFYPQLILASDKDKAYRPYAQSNVQLTKNKVEASAIAPTEDGTTASKAYAEGEYFIRGGKLCICKTAISSGGSFTLNTNYLESPNLGYELRNKRIVRAREVTYATGVSGYGSEKVMCIEFSDGSILVNGAMKVSASYTSGDTNYLLFTLPSGITFPHSTRQRWAVFNEFMSGNKAIPILFGDPGNTAKAWSSAVTLADLQDKNFIVDISW